MKELFYSCTIGTNAGLVADRSAWALLLPLLRVGIDRALARASCALLKAAPTRDAAAMRGFRPVGAPSEASCVTSRSRVAASRVSCVSDANTCSHGQALLAPRILAGPATVRHSDLQCPTCQQGQMLSFASVHQ